MQDVTINIQFVRHEGSDLILAISKDHKGLYVHGRSLAEVETRVEEAIRSIFEAEGKHIVVLHRVNDDSVRQTGFIPAFARYNAELEAA